MLRFGILYGKFPNLLSFLQHFRDQIRKALQSLDNRLPVHRGEISHSPEGQPEHCAKTSLRGKGFRGSDSNFRTNSLIDSTIRLSCQRRANHAGNPESEQTLGLCFPNRFQGIQGFSGLTYCDDQRLSGLGRVTVAKLRCMFDLNGYAPSVRSNIRLPCTRVWQFRKLRR